MSELPLVHYHCPQTRSVTIQWLFEELGSPPHETQIINVRKGEQKSPAYLAINPMGKVPAIMHGTTVVSEVGAIAIYLADLFPQAGLTPAIGDPARGTYLRWIVFNHGAIEPAVADRSRKIESGLPSALGYGTYDDTVNALAAAIGKGPYILGETFSAADVVIGSALRWLMMFKLLPDRPEFAGYVGRLTARPAFKRASEKDAEILKSLES